GSLGGRQRSRPLTLDEHRPIDACVEAGAAVEGVVARVAVEAVIALAQPTPGPVRLERGEPNPDVRVGARDRRRATRLAALAPTSAGHASAASRTRSWRNRTSGEALNVASSEPGAPGSPSPDADLPLPARHAASQEPAGALKAPCTDRPCGRRRRSASRRS